VSARWTDGEEDANVDVVLRRRLLRAAFQSIVCIDSELTAGLRAVIRGPLGSPLERADQLFAAAERRGRVTPLDTLCFDVVVEAGDRAKLQAPLAVFADRDVTAFVANPTAPATKTSPIVLVFAATTTQVRPLVDATALARRLGYCVAFSITDERDVPAVTATTPDYVIVDTRTIDAASVTTLASSATLIAAAVDSETTLAHARELGIAYAYGMRFGRPDLLVRAPLVFDRAGVKMRPRSSIWIS
jgi:hypothetical protein